MFCIQTALAVLLILSKGFSNEVIPHRTKLALSSRLNLPVERKFLATRHEILTNGQVESHGILRVLQFNMLADGLSGLTPDLGAFSRVTAEDLCWERRKDQILHEIFQYNPDVITLQECDHYYDFFLPSLVSRGFDGIYSPKPASACLQISKNSDGCAIFVRRSKLEITSVETLTFALSKNDVAEEDQQRPPDEKDKLIRAQNQVALIAICELVTGKNSPPVVISTTHLKAAKSAKGERFRKKEILQLMDAINRACGALTHRPNPHTSAPPLAPAVILTGDLNACPIVAQKGYSPLAFHAVKQHSLGLRSVLNDDVDFIMPGQGGVLPPLYPWTPPEGEPTALSPQANNAVTGDPVRGHKNEEKETEAVTESDKQREIERVELRGPYGDPVWTTWKVRRKKGAEEFSRHCIDYILYKPVTPAPLAVTTGAGVDNELTTETGSSGMGSSTAKGRHATGIRTTAILDLLPDGAVGPSLLPSPDYPSDHIAIGADLEIIVVHDEGG